MPIVQTKLAAKITEKLKRELKVNISIDQVSITIFGSVKLKQVLIRDHKNDTLIYSKRIRASLADVKSIVAGNLSFGTVQLDDAFVNVKTYRGEDLTNLDLFINAVDSDTIPSKNPFLLKAKEVNLGNSRFKYTDENNANPVYVDFSKLNVRTGALNIRGSNLFLNIKSLSYLGHGGLFVKNINGIFSFTESLLELRDMEIKTEESHIKGNFKLHHKNNLSDFSNRVIFDSRITSSVVSTNDLKFFYGEFGKDIFFEISSEMKGTLNNLDLSNLQLRTLTNSSLNGDIHIRNILGNEDELFSVNAKIDLFTSNYQDLVTLMPNLLGKNLPKKLKILKEVNMSGSVEASPNSVNMDVVVNTALGKISPKILINNIQKAAPTYLGNIILDDFDIGTMLEQDKLGKTSLVVNITGAGFSEDLLNTYLEASVSKLTYNNYEYNDLQLYGEFKNKHYNTHFTVDDDNLKMTLDGDINNENEEIVCDVAVDIHEIDLHKTNFVKDSIALVKGKMTVSVKGKDIEDVRGIINIYDVKYKNLYKVFEINRISAFSSFNDDKIRTISFISDDALSGKIVGRYKISQLGDLAVNSLGSLYSHYKPLVVDKNQFLDFDLTIHDKIVEMFLPKLTIADNTTFNGAINSDDGLFKLNFLSKTIKLSDNYFKNISVVVNNKSKLNKAEIKIDTIKFTNYKMKDFRFVNRSKNDTLIFNITSKGVSDTNDYVDLNMFHTINSEDNNVVGMYKSEIKFRNYLWDIQEKASLGNKLVFDKQMNNFYFDKLKFSHDNEFILLDGSIKGDDYKDLKLTVKDVNIDKIIFKYSGLDMYGVLNANIIYKQNKDVYKPYAFVEVSNLNINKQDIGNLEFEIEGDEIFNVFEVNASIRKRNSKTFDLDGSFELQNNKTLLDLKLGMEDFNIDFLAPLGEDVISKIRGKLSGNSSITGTLKEPDINGRFFLEDVAFNLPLLNIDYVLDYRSVIDFTSNKIIFRDNSFTDTKFKTKGTFKGLITHKDFSDWNFDLNFDSKKLAVLDTKDSEDAYYFGTAFINGGASITGGLDALFIKVKAKSEKGTSLKIPINTSESVGENRLIRFISKKEKKMLENGEKEQTTAYNGVDLDFDLEITPDAEAEIILDRSTGHGMKGKGNGNLLFKINTLGKFNMFGNFHIVDGIYNFKYSGVIDKKLKIKEGSSISWDGDPLKANLNLKAIYKTFANPAVLLENSTFNKKIDTHLIIDLQGELSSLQPKFTIDFPTVSSVMKSEIDYKLADENVRQTQALYLLSTGSFLSSTGASQSDISGSIFETVSSYLDKALTAETSDEPDRFNVGVNLISSEKKAGKETDGRVEATFSSQLNDRIIFNGKVGVPYGGTNESTVVGSFEIRYNIKEDGSVSARVFNKENDVTYIGEGIGYTQGVGASYSVDFNTFDELYAKVFKQKKENTETKKTPKKEKEPSLDDSNMEAINEKKKHKPTHNTSKESDVPEED